LRRASHSAHKRGIIIRRDLKPANIVVTTDGTVKIRDFGLAKLEFDQKITQTLAGTTMGTVAYLSPEQVDELQVGSRTDWWPLGGAARIAGKRMLSSGSRLSS